MDKVDEKCKRPSLILNEWLNRSKLFKFKNLYDQMDLDSDQPLPITKAIIVLTDMSRGFDSEASRCVLNLPTMLQSYMLREEGASECFCGAALEE